ncbi:MFS transporter [Catenulispora pinisilvae]|uniref:MFS transporter n=1 Tax=Catenulispora pinisilvae TaxID=2705253 RepID=UPI001892695F|nr:MFS transporter [Catenulispora pinisilvae]
MTQTTPHPTDSALPAPRRSPDPATAGPAAALGDPALGDPAPAAPPATPAFNHRLIVPLLLGATLNPINSSMIAIALVPIGAAFGASPASTAWLVSSLYLATAIGQPVIGRLVDRFGARPLYLTGAALVGLAGVIGTAAPSLSVLIVARVLLGFGTSAQFPAAMHTVRGEAQRTGLKTPSGILTALSISAQSTMVIGPTLGGALVSVGGWRFVFAINIPLALVCIALGTRSLPKSKTVPNESRIDLVGMALFAAMLTSLLLFLMNLSVDNLYLLAVAAVFAAVFARVELRTGEPFIDLRIFGGNTPLLVTYLRQTLTYILTYSFIYGFTQWLEEGRGLSASEAGLVVLPTSLTAIVVAWFSGRRSGIRSKLIVGTASIIAASGGLLILNRASAIWVLLAVGLLAGATQGMNGLANQNALFRQADAARMGTAAGLLRTFQYLGAILSSAAVAIVFRTGASSGGLHELAVVMIGCGVLLLAVVLADRSLSLRTTDREPTR